MINGLRPDDSRPYRQVITMLCPPFTTYTTKAWGVHCINFTRRLLFTIAPKLNLPHAEARSAKASFFALLGEPC
jgi:hypothetical protein